jgi:hypothetical protein
MRKFLATTPLMIAAPVLAAEQPTSEHRSQLTPDQKAQHDARKAPAASVPSRRNSPKLGALTLR